MGSRPEVASPRRAHPDPLRGRGRARSGRAARRRFGGFPGAFRGACDAPPRQAVAGDDGSVLVMSGRARGGPVAVKLVGVFPGNAALGLESHLATVCLLDATTGRALALMDGEAITALRTAAGSALLGPARSRVRCVACSRSSAPASRPARICRCCRWCARSRRSASSRAIRAPPSGSASPPERSRAPTSSASAPRPREPVLPLADVAPGHPRHLRRLRPAGRRARPGARRPRPPVRREPPGVLGPARRLRRARGPRPGDRHRARRDPVRPRPRPHIAATRSPSTSRSATSPRTPPPPQLVYETALERGLGREIDL